MPDQSVTLESLRKAVDEFCSPEPTEAEWLAMREREKFQHVLSKPGAYIVVSRDVFDALKSQAETGSLGVRVEVRWELPPGSMVAVAPEGV